MNKSRIHIWCCISILTSLFSGFLFSCANRGAGPQGGPKDENPPVVVKSTPKNNEVNFKNKKIEIDFDEIVVLNQFLEKSTSSPTTTKAPVVKALGKKISIEYEDTLQENTTYTINFSDAIVDNNEGNPLKNYSFAFSTGNVLDTLKISGSVIDAETLNPIKGILVGIHQNLHDSAFTTLPLERIAKTNEEGKFTINNVKEGTYRVFALHDIGGNYFFDLPNEKLAFSDSIFQTKITIESKFDTIMIDSLTIDTIIEKQILRYEPENIILAAFEEKHIRHDFIKGERKEPHKFTLFFSEKQDSIPKIVPLNFEWENNYIIQQNKTQDTLAYWITDSLTYATDSLKFELYYPFTDTLNNVVLKMDTIVLPVKAPKQKNNSQQESSRKKSKKKENENEKKKVEHLKITNNVKGPFDVYNDVVLSFDVPIKHYDTAKIHLERKKDTLWIPIPIELKVHDASMKFSIEQEWIPEEEYRLVLDSAAFHEYYGKSTNKTKVNIKIRSLEEYANLYVILKNFTGKEILQLLNSREKVERETKVTDVETAFENLNPGDYYLKIFVDENDNGVWDTGNYAENRQAEKVYFYPAKINLRAFWDVEEEWDYTQTPLLQQKPKELYKKDSK